MTKEVKRKKRIVEIYFVLYLAALVLIIPDFNNKPTKIGSDVFELPFSIKPEKTAMFCKLSLDSNGIEIINIDSINTIYHTGNVSEINYEFIIEDQILKQKVKLDYRDENINKYFRIRENKEQQTAEFAWNPPIHDKENKTYNVQVIATAKLNDDLNSGRIIKSKTQFTLVVNYYDKNSGKPINPINGSISNLNIPITGITEAPVNVNLGDFSLSPKNDAIRTIAYEEWQNEVFILGSFNLQTDLLKNPVIKIHNNPDNNGGSAYIANYFSNGILIKGKAPAFGNSKVQLTLVRKYDKKEESVFFNVIPQAVGTAEYPKEMYPGITYTFNPNLPFASGQETKAILRDVNNNIRAQNSQGGEFNFSPIISDTGKIFTFERYVNNNLFGQKYKIQVKNYPSPEIKRLQTVSGQELILQAASFGYYNGRENLIQRLEIIGNAKAFEQNGNYKPDSKNQVWLHTYKIVPKDASKPFEFSVRAIDRRGFKSEEKLYKEE